MDVYSLSERGGCLFPVADSEAKAQRQCSMQEISGVLFLESVDSLTEFTKNRSASYYHRTPVILNNVS